MLFVIFLLLFCTQTIVRSTDESQNSPLQSEFNWQGFVNWPSSPETEIEQTGPILPTKHDAPQVDSPTSPQILRDRESLKAYYHEVYLRERNNPQKWKNRLNGQRLNRLKKMKKEEESLAVLSIEEREAALRAQKQKGKEKYMKYKNMLIQQGKKPGSDRLPIRDLSPKAKEERRAKNRDAARKYRKTLKQRAKKQPDGR